MITKTSFCESFFFKTQIPLFRWSPKPLHHAQRKNDSFGIFGGSLGPLERHVNSHVDLGNMWFHKWTLSYAHAYVNPDTRARTRCDAHVTGHVTALTFGHVTTHMAVLHVAITCELTHMSLYMLATNLFTCGRTCQLPLHMCLHMLGLWRVVGTNTSTCKQRYQRW